MGKGIKYGGGGGAVIQNGELFKLPSLDTDIPPFSFVEMAAKTYDPSAYTTLSFSGSNELVRNSGIFKVAENRYLNFHITSTSTSAAWVYKCDCIEVSDDGVATLISSTVIENFPNHNTGMYFNGGSAGQPLTLQLDTNTIATFYFKFVSGTGMVPQFRKITFNNDVVTVGSAVNTNVLHYTSTSANDYNIYDWAVMGDKILLMGGRFDNWTVAKVYLMSHDFEIINSVDATGCTIYFATFHEMHKINDNKALFFWGYKAGTSSSAAVRTAFININGNNITTSYVDKAFSYYSGPSLPTTKVVVSGNRMYTHRYSERVSSSSTYGDLSILNIEGDNVSEIVNLSTRVALGCIGFGFASPNKLALLTINMGYQVGTEVISVKDDVPTIIVPNAVQPSTGPAWLESTKRYIGNRSTVKMSDGFFLGATFVKQGTTNDNWGIAVHKHKVAVKLPTGNTCQGITKTKCKPEKAGKVVIL